LPRIFSCISSTYHFVSRAGPPPTTELVGVGRPERAAPEANGFVTDLNAALSEQFFDVTMAQIETEVQPDGVADDLGRETMATVQGRVDGRRRILHGPKRR
jgi:hypothetical protein